MKYLGIDYGSKNVGVAISDDGGNLAFPKTVLKNDKNLIFNLSKICEDEKVEVIIIGESKNLDGQNNLIQEKILDFKKEVEEKIKLSVYLEPEFLTSFEAERYQKNNENLDASAAALILMRYLDKKNNE